MWYSHNKVKLSLFIVALICMKGSYKLFNIKKYQLGSYLKASHVKFQKEGVFPPKCPILDPSLASKFIEMSCQMRMMIHNTLAASILTHQNRQLICGLSIQPLHCAFSLHSNNSISTQCSTFASIHLAHVNLSIVLYILM